MCTYSISQHVGGLHYNVRRVVKQMLHTEPKSLCDCLQLAQNRALVVCAVEHPYAHIRHTHTCLKVLSVIPFLCTCSGCMACVVTNETDPTALYTCRKHVSVVVRYLVCRVLLAPLFGQAAPGNLGMQSSLLNLPSRASPPPAPSPANALGLNPSTSPSSGNALSPSPSPGKGPSNAKQSSLRAFLSPGKGHNHMQLHGVNEGSGSHMDVHNTGGMKSETASGVAHSGKSKTTRFGQ